MIAQARFKSVHWVLLGALALAPTAVLAQQDKTSQGQKQPDRPEAVPAKTQAVQEQTDTAQARTDAAQEQTEEAPAKTEEDAKLKSVPGGKALGMSVLGNQEAPTSLTIVPWKSSELGNGLGISPMLDDSRLPIDKEVFMRMLSYYEIRSETRPDGAPAKTNAAQPAAAARRGEQ